MAKKAPVPATKAQIIAALAEKAGVTKAQAKIVLESLVCLACEGAKANEKGFVIPGLGKLVLVKRAARTGRNPRTGETIKIPAKKTVKFRLVKGIKDAILPTKK